MYKNKILFRVLLVCICIILFAGGIGAQAASANPVLQVNSEVSSASIEDGMIQVCVAEKDVFTYNEILDLSTASKDVQLLNMQFEPVQIGIPNATRVKIRFTDLYDEDNYITISLNCFADSWASGHIYVTAGAADQPQIGIENAGDPSNSKVYVDDIYGYGAAVDYSMVGLPKKSEDAYLTLYFDYTEKAIYVDRESYTHAKQLVVDLDDPDLFGTNLWTGFTTGQVKMSVFASNYKAATCDFTISTINGNSGFQATDQSAPIISVNTGYDQDALPNALVGKPYPIFPATAIDGCDGNVDVTAVVHYDEGNGRLTKVAVEDGKFTPSQEGVYVIEYTSKDLSGNISTANVNVSAIIGDGLQVTLRDVISEVETGLPVQVISGIDYVDASGNVSYYITAKNAATGDQVEIDPKTLSFTPMAAGDWEVTVTVQDHVSTVEKTFTVNVLRTSQPQVYDTVVLQDYFIQGATYQLPVLYGYDFSSGKGVLTAMNVYVTENGSSEKAVANGSYVPANEGTVTVTYRLTVDGKTCEKSYTATVVKTKTILGTESLSKYFVDPTGAATGSATSAKITYSFKKDTKLNFVNFVQVKQLSFAFQVGSQNAYDRISVYLTDIMSGKQVKLSYIKTTDGAAFAINDGKAVTLSSAFDSSLSLAFSNDTAIVIPESDKELKVKTFLDGSEFTGFTDSVARFTVELSGVTGSSQFVVQTLNGQKLNNAIKDSTAPQLIANAVSGNIDRGETLLLKGAFAYDVLNPIATMTLKVTDPDGNAVTDQNGVVLNGAQDATIDSPVLLEKLGVYTILYTVVDGNKNTARQVYTITVTDGEGPIITLLEHTEAVKTGETVTIAGTQVQDNITANCTVVSYVYDPEGVNVPVANGTFTATQSGVYTVRYMAIDGDGNYTFFSYEVTSRDDTAHYLSQSMSLGSDLILHLWGNVPEGYVGSLSGSLAYDGVREDFRLSELTQTADGLYHMQAELAAAQMTDPVNLNLKHKIIGDVIRKSYSIQDYLVTLIEGDYDQATKDLSLELLNMGAWAQKYFDYNVSNLANTGYEITPANSIGTESPSVRTIGRVNGIRFYGTSVRFLSKTAVRYYFKANGAVDGYTFTINGVEYEPVEKDGLYYVETPGINPQNMSDVITVQVTDGSDTLSVEYAPIWYFIRTYNKSADATIQGLMEAAYSYYKEAEAYEQTVTPGQIKQPEAPTGEGVYIYLDVMITTLSNSNDPVELRFYAHDYTGSVHASYTDKVTVTAGKKTTVKLNAEKYMVDGVIPEGLGIAVFGGPEWNTTLPDGSDDRHTLTISNVWLKGEYKKLLDLRTATVDTGNNGTGYTDANNGGQVSIIDGKIVIENGYRYDAHKITLSDDPTKNITYLCMDLQLDTLGGNWENDIEIRFYPYNYEGSIRNYYKDCITVKAGTAETVKLSLNRYLVDGELPGIGIAIFGGPTRDAKLPDGVTPDRHTLSVSNMRLEGGQQKVIDLSKTTFARGNDGTGYTDANGNGVAAIADGKIVISDGFCYDAHKVNFNTVEDSGTTDPDTYVVLDMQIDTLGSNWTNNIEIRFYPYNFQGNPHESYTDCVLFKAGEKQSVKLKADEYLVDGELSGIGIGIFGGPEWNTQISGGVYDRHTVTISGIRLVGTESIIYDLSQSTMVSGTTNTGYTDANGWGSATIGDSIVITGGIRYDCHKISLIEVPDTCIVLDMLLTTLGNSNDKVDIAFFPYNFTGDINANTDKIAIPAGTQTTVKLELSKYLVDGAFNGIGFVIFGGPEWNTQLGDGTYDRHSLTISSVKLEGKGAKEFDLSQSVWAKGGDAGYTNANGSGEATIGSSIVITNGYRYDGHKISLVEDTNTYIVMDLQLDTQGGNWADPIEIRFFNNAQTDSVHNTYADLISVAEDEKVTVKLNAEKYLVDGVLPGFSIGVFGGPEWNDAAGAKHAVTISNLRLEGVGAADIDLSTAAVITGLPGSNAGGQIAIVDGQIVITGGIRYDAHKITFVDETIPEETEPEVTEPEVTEPEVTEPPVEEPDTYISLDVLINTVGNSTDPIEVRFYPDNYEGSVHNGYTDLVNVTAGTTTTVKLDASNYLVNGELTGIGFGIFGGPEWNDAAGDRHTVTISNVKLEGEQSAVYDLSQSQIATGNNGTGYTDANGWGSATIGDSIVITGGIRYDAHKISLVEKEESGETEPDTYVVLDVQIDTIGGNWTNDIEIRFYPYNFQGNPHETYTDIVILQAGERQTVKLDASNYLVNGELTGIGIGIFGGPEWNDAAGRKHTVTISNVKLEGELSKAFDLNKSVVTSGTNGTGYTNANGWGSATIGSSIVITGGIRYDAHKISLS